MTLPATRNPNRTPAQAAKRRTSFHPRCCWPKTRPVGHLKETGHGHGAGGGQNRRGHYRGGRMGRGGPEQLTHDHSALAVEAGMPAQIGVDPVIGQGTQQDDEREDADQQRSPD
jgi:hypothetical protein